MIEKSPNLQEVEKNPLDFLLECPKCGGMVNARYALALSPILGVVKILPNFYCPCNRFQPMVLKTVRPKKEESIIDRLLTPWAIVLGVLTLSLVIISIIGLIRCLT